MPIPPATSLYTHHSRQSPASQTKANSQDHHHHHLTFGSLTTMMDIFNLKRSSSAGSDASSSRGTTSSSSSSSNTAATVVTNTSTSSSSTSSSSSQQVVAIECAPGSASAEEWGGGVDLQHMLQPGDIVVEVKAGDSASRAPFKGGRSALNKMMQQAYRKGETSVVVKIRRGKDEPAIELAACISPIEASSGSGGSGKKQQYVLRSPRDPAYAVMFVNRAERECLELQGSKGTRASSALDLSQLQDGFVSYPWEKKMKEALPIPRSSGFLSMLFLPKSSTEASSSQQHFATLDDTLARANAWLNSAQAAGVPVVFVNVQTEALLTKVSGEKTSSRVVNSSGSISEMSNIANSSVYGFDDYHGVDIGVVKAVRLWYTPISGECAVEIKLLETDTKLGFAVSRTEEGFIYISSVVDDDDSSLPSTRSGLRELYKEASRASKLLVISRISGDKVLPWMVSTAGAIRCFDTVALSQKLSLHRHALKTILIHILMFDRAPRQQQQYQTASGQPRRGAGGGGRGVLVPPSSEQVMRNISLHEEVRMARDAGAGGVEAAPFRFIDFPISNNWAPGSDL